MSMHTCVYMCVVCTCVWCVHVCGMYMCVVCTCVWCGHVCGVYMCVVWTCVWCLHVCGMYMCVVWTCVWCGCVWCGHVCGYMCAYVWYVHVCGVDTLGFFIIAPPHSEGTGQAFVVPLMGRGRSQDSIGHQLLHLLCQHQARLPGELHLE